MHWSIEENLAEIESAMRLAHSRGARLCAFSELAVTGFHREIVALAKPERIEPAIRRVQALAVELGQAVALGAPTFGAAGGRFNSHLLVDESGRIVAAIDKNGLTDPEATFFERGTTRPSAALQGVASSAVICREVEDHDAVLTQLRGGQPELVFWPGLMRPERDKPSSDPPIFVVQAQDLARQADAYVVQTNWPNALNRPEESTDTGHSACIAPDGALLFRLPKEGFGVGVFALGAREFEWHLQ